MGARHKETPNPRNDKNSLPLAGGVGMAKKRDSITLWGRKFQIVRYGLDENQIIVYVDQLLENLKEAQEKADKASYPASLDKLAERTLIEAEKLAASLKQDAEQIRGQAQAEAVSIVEEAQRAAQEQGESIGKVAKSAGEEAQKVVQAAREKGALIEAEARREAERFLEFTKQQIQVQIRRDVKGASDKPLGYVDDVLREVQTLDASLEGWEPTPEAGSPPEATAEQQPIAQADASLPPEATAEEAPTAQTEAGPADTEGDETPLHEGPLEVVIQAPVHPAGLGEVYGRLGRLRGVSVRDTSRADDGSYVINLSFGSPTPLSSIFETLENIADVSVGPGDIGAPPAMGPERRRARKSTRPGSW